MNDTVVSETKTKNSDGSIQEQRAVTGFTGIRVSGSATLQVVQGDREWLIVQADEELMPQVITEVVDGTLHLRLNDNFSRGLFNRRTVHFFVGCKTLNTVELSGSTAARITALNTPEFLCTASGSALLEIPQLEAKYLRVKASGGANVTISGHVDEQTLTCSGVIRYNGGQLRSRQAQIDVSGAGDLTLWAEELLDVRSASGACKVHYYGAPEVRHVRNNIMLKLDALGEPVPQP